MASARSITTTHGQYNEADILVIEAGYDHTIR